MFEDSNDKNALLFIEYWETIYDQAEHMNTRHIKAFDAVVGDIIASSPSVAIVRPI